MPSQLHTASSSVINVAVGVVLKPNGEFLLACRPNTTSYAGYWEFPGGKFEAGETGYICLKRELYEELGIEVTHADPWLTQVFHYPDKSVRLHFFCVRTWRGEPRAREGQSLSWQFPNKVTVTPVLPANTPILRALNLPPIYAITQAAAYGEEVFLARLARALNTGLRFIQIREKQMSYAQLQQFATRVIGLAQSQTTPSSGPIIVTINTDIALSQQVGAHGVHLNAQQLMQLPARPDVPLCGASCHNTEELERAALLGCDFVALSPVLATATHPGAATLGWPAFAQLIKDYPLPVYALGGMQSAWLAKAQMQGAHGISMCSGSW